ncbi:hypothetical protein ACFXKJ_41915, partial [Kitasatospora indigofera]|uniref:hypothetical protein n=1 Tax=Kitasatospora indigofera TaxID=67307 RepID=UPI00367AD010
MMLHEFVVFAGVPPMDRYECGLAVQRSTHPERICCLPACADLGESVVPPAREEAQARLSHVVADQQGPARTGVVQA